MRQRVSLVVVSLFLEVAGVNHHSFSHESSSVVSVSEYYDAAEYLLDNDSSSEVWFWNRLLKLNYKSSRNIVILI